MAKSGKTLKAKHLAELRYIASPVFSPDGSQLAAVETQAVTREEVPRYQSDIVSYDLSGNRRQLTYSGFSNTAPQFSPDGRYLAYLSKREAKASAQLMLLPLSGGEAQPLTRFEAGVSAFAWHPDGDRLVYVSRGDVKNDNAEGLGRVIDRRRYRFDGVGFIPTAPPAIYLHTISRNKTRQLVTLETDASDLTFSPDGETLYYLSATEAQYDAFKQMIFGLSLKTKQVKALLKSPGRISALSVSPDGKTLAFLAPSRWELFASPTGLWTLSRKRKTPQLRTTELDITSGDGVAGDCRYGAVSGKPKWLTPDALLITVNRAGRNNLYTFDVHTSTLTESLGGERAITGFAVAGDKLAFIAETPDRPAELFLYDGQHETQLSQLNDDFVATYRPLSPDHATLTTEDGAELGYWTLRPRKPRKDKAVVLQVHGGPHTNYGYGFIFEFQLLAAAGFTVVYGNPRGSSSFGDDFATTILGRYGTVDASDVLAMLEHALNGAEPPVHLTGGSYGGFMTNWLIGHTDRFRSAVTQRSISNWLSFFGTSDIGYNFTPIEQGGNPWQDTERLWDQSPIKYVKNISTPLLILHSEADYRCPIEQAEQLFIALKTLGKETRLIRFPDEGHELSRSGRIDRRIQRLEAIIDWFKRH
jgi:dipeptidyl aminopeptidase/acylaminoacyl peptidase